MRINPLSGVKTSAWNLSGGRLSQNHLATPKQTANGLPACLSPISSPDLSAKTPSQQLRPTAEEVRRKWCALWTNHVQGRAGCPAQPSEESQLFSNADNDFSRELLSLCPQCAYYKGFVPSSLKQDFRSTALKAQKGTVTDCKTLSSFLNSFLALAFSK